MLHELIREIGAELEQRRIADIRDKECHAMLEASRNYRGTSIISLSRRFIVNAPHRDRN